MYHYIDGPKLRQLREKQLMDQRELATIAGVSVSTIPPLELGYRRCRTSTLRSIAGVLGVAPEELILPKDAARVIDLKVAKGRRRRKANHQSA